MSVFLPDSKAAALRERFASVLARIEQAARNAGRNRNEIRLVAISKTHPAPVLAELCRFWPGGPAVFGENYAQEALDKQAAVASLLVKSLPDAPAPEWHFTGHAQSRKARDIVGRFSLIHTLDSEKLAARIQKIVQEQRLPPQAVLIQVNVGEEPQKSGVMPEKAEALVTSVMRMPEISVQGLMCLPPFFKKAEASRPYFARLRELRGFLARSTGLDLPHLSMGMSHDCEAAVAEGATIVRIGTDIFGPRPPKT